MLDVLSFGHIDYIFFTITQPLSLYHVVSNAHHKYVSVCFVCVYNMQNSYQSTHTMKFEFNRMDIEPSNEGNSVLSKYVYSM